MILLDISKVQKPKWFPKNVPDKIPLQPGGYDADWDLHPMVRNTKWYRGLRRVISKRNPDKSFFLPIGVNTKALITAGAKLIGDKDD